MSRRACTFKQRDVTRLLKAVDAAGVKVARVEVDASGKLVVVTDNSAEQVLDRDEWEDINGTH
jgi:hypothetical protein